MLGVGQAVVQAPGIGQLHAQAQLDAAVQGFPGVHRAALVGQRILEAEDVVLFRHVVQRDLVVQAFAVAAQADFVVVHQHRLEIEQGFGGGLGP
ncbi:hypothetical protein D3C72_1984570 [compost metagenome]